jgi:hypothetical protein
VKILAKIAKEQAMSAAVIANTLVSLEESRTRSRMRAYANILSDLNGIVSEKSRRSLSWLRNLITYGGSVPGEIERAFDAMLVKHLEAQFVRLQAELDVARQRGAHPASAHITEIESHLAKVRALLSGGAQ